MTIVPSSACSSICCSRCRTSTTARTRHMTCSDCSLLQPDCMATSLRALRRETRSASHTRTLRERMVACVS